MALLLAATVGGCGGNASRDPAGSGGSAATTGGSTTGGAQPTTGGTPTGGTHSTSGGTPTGGTHSTSGGTPTGGTHSAGGGTPTGGSTLSSGGMPPGCRSDPECNDSPFVSSLWGRCSAGVCVCNEGRELNPSTGRCGLPRDVTISLQRGPCFGTCPVYSVRIEGTGLVTYEGTEFVKVRGPASRMLNAVDPNALADELERNDYFNLAVPDDCANVSSDAPTVTTSLTRTGRSHEVKDYKGNGCAPPILDTLEKRIDEIAGTAEWVLCTPAPCAR